MKIWMEVFGDSEVQVRMLAVLLGTLAVVVAYIETSKYGTKFSTILFALLFALHPFAIYYSQEAGVYALLLLFSTVSLLLFASWVRENDGGYPLPAFLLVSAALLYTHYYGAIIIVFENLIYFFFVNGGNGNRDTKWWKGQLILLVCYAIWFPSAIWHLFYLPQGHLQGNIEWWPLVQKLLFGIPLGIAVVKTRHFFRIQQLILYFIGVSLLLLSYFPLHNWREGGLKGPISWETLTLKAFILYSILFAVIVFLSNVNSFSSWRNKIQVQSIYVLSILFVLFYIGVIEIVGLLLRPIYSLHSMIPIVPFVLLLLVGLAEKISHRSLKIAFALCMIAVEAFAFPSAYRFFPRPDYRGIAHQIESAFPNPSERPLIVSFSTDMELPVRYYIRTFQKLYCQEDCVSKTRDAKSTLWIWHTDPQFVEDARNMHLLVEARAKRIVSQRFSADGIEAVLLR